MVNFSGEKALSTLVRRLIKTCSRIGEAKVITPNIATYTHVKYSPYLQILNQHKRVVLGGLLLTEVSK